MLVRVEPPALFSWLFLNSSHLLPFLLTIPLFLPSLTGFTSGSARLSLSRSGFSSSTTSLRNSWAVRGESTEARRRLGSSRRQAKRGGKVFWNAAQSDGHLPSSGNPSIASQPLLKRQTIMRSLRPGQR